MLRDRPRRHHQIFCVVRRRVSTASSGGTIRLRPEHQRTLPFDPEKAKALLKQVGFPNGVDVDFFTRPAAICSTRPLRPPSCRCFKRLVSGRHCTRRSFDLWRTSSVERSVVLLGPTISYRSIRLWRSFLDRRLAPHRNIRPRHRSLAALGAGDLRSAGRKKILNKAFDAILDAAPACFLWRYEMSMVSPRISLQGAGRTILSIRPTSLSCNSRMAHRDGRLMCCLQCFGRA